jgi:hypothetical protein
LYKYYKQYNSHNRSLEHVPLKSYRVENIKLIRVANLVEKINLMTKITSELDGAGYFINSSSGFGGFLDL